MTKKANKAVATAPKTDTNPALLKAVPQQEVAAEPAPIDYEALAKIVQAGGAGIMAPKSVYLPLRDAGFVVVNEEHSDEAGHSLTIATQKGNMEHMQQNTEYQAPTQVDASYNPAEDAQYAQNASGYTVQEPHKYTIDDGYSIPEAIKSGKRGRAAVYPIKELEVGQSFFVPKHPGKDNMAKSLLGTINAAKAHFSVPVPGQFKYDSVGDRVPVKVPTREFVVRNVEGGARIWRVK